MAAITWRSSQPAPHAPPSHSAGRFHPSETRSPASSMVSTSFAASTLLHSIFTSLSRLSLDRSTSPKRQRVPKKREKDTTLPAQKRVGSGTHRKNSHSSCGSNPQATQPTTVSSNSSRLTTVRRFAVMNSLARSGTVEGDFAKWAVTALARSSSGKQYCRRDFHPKPSRLSVMSKGEDDS